MRIKWLIANTQGSLHDIDGKYHSLWPETHPYFHSTSSRVSGLSYLRPIQNLQPPSWFVAPHFTFPAPFWVIPRCTSWIIFLRNRSIKSLCRPLVVSHCSTNNVMTSHPGIQSPLKSDFCRLPRPSPRDSAPSLTFSTLCHFHSSCLYLCSHSLFCRKIFLTLPPAVILSKSHPSFVTQFILFLFLICLLWSLPTEGPFSRFLGWLVCITDLCTYSHIA